MKIKFNIDTIKPMYDWLLEYKQHHIRDEKKLREILSLPDYQIEFERYALKELPVCGISLEEAVDFFMHFDEKEFDNPRLQSKLPSFLAFYDELEERMRKIELFTTLDQDDYELIETLLVNGLPQHSLDNIQELNIILIISIGNSMGWPYEHYIDYDLANLDAFKCKKDFLHVTAHEINHIFAGELLFPDGIKPEDYFLQSFAYEGLAVHYNNNLETIGKPKKYDDQTYVMNEEDMKFYEEHFDEIFEMIRNDYYDCKDKTIDEVDEILSNHYEQFEFMNKPIKQYPTYYFGCYLWGLIDLHYGKEKLYEAISNPKLFVQLYNQIANQKYCL